MVLVVPSISVFIFTKLGFQVRRVWFLAWLTLFPVIVCFPQISQVRDIHSFLRGLILAKKKKNVKWQPITRSNSEFKKYDINKGW
jgi:hypothetical protein